MSLFWKSAALSTLVLALSAGRAAAAADPAVQCQVLRLKLAASYASCVLKADAKAAADGASADHTACDDKMQTKWAAIDARYGAACPATNEVSLVQGILEECTADALVPPASYDIVLAVTNAVSLGAIQFTVDYSSSNGELPGSGALVSCSNLAAGAMFAPDDDDASQALEVGIVAMTPVATPADLVTCRFDRLTWGLPEAADFTITVDNAFDGFWQNVSATVEIVSITPAP